MFTANGHYLKRPIGCRMSDQKFAIAPIQLIIQMTDWYLTSSAGNWFIKSLS